MLKFPKPGKRIKKGRLVDAAHIQFIAKLCCLCCGRKDETIVAHHLLRGVTRGMGMKAGDNHTIPLCHSCHDRLHRNGDETKFLAAHGVLDAVNVAERLYSISRDL